MGQIYLMKMIHKTSYIQKQIANYTRYYSELPTVIDRILQTQIHGLLIFQKVNTEHVK